MNFWYFGGPFWGLGIFGGILWLLIILLIIAIIARGPHPPHWHDHGYRHGHRHYSAMDLLRERYAKGEITREQFESMKEDLREEE